MKQIKYISAIWLMGMLALVGCSDFGDINIDPNNTVSVLPQTLLTSSLRSISSITGATTGELYAQHMAETQYSDASRYSTVNFDFNGWYTGPLADLQHIIDLNSSEDTRAEALASGSNANQIAVARIMKAFFFHHMTDRWGPLPYSQALQGRENFSPSYDSQEAIYDAVISELKGAVGQMDGGAGVEGDFIMGGDMELWKQFANTVRMTAALRLSKVNPGKAQSEFADAYNGGILTDGVYYPYLAEANNQNPWFGRFITRTDYAISDVLANFMMTQSDPRLNAYADPAPNTGTVVGMPYGIEAAGDIPNADISFPHFPNVRGQDAPIAIFSKAQIHFMIAEGAARGWIGEDAQANYEAAIQASMEQWGVFDQAAFDAYIAQDGVAYDAANWDKLIGEQKWVALYLQGYEAWNEWKRTGFPELQPAPDPLNASGEIPRRQAYPTTERDINSTNYDAAVSGLLGGPDELSTRLWWDQ